MSPTANPTGEDGGATRPPTDGDVGWRGWLVVATFLVAFLVVSAAILLLPAARDVVSGFGLTLRDAYLSLPLPAATLLGAMADGAALASRRQ